MYEIYCAFPNEVYKSLPSLLISTLRLKYNSDNDKWYGLYAVARDKKSVKYFMKYRKKKFFLYKEIDDDSFNKDDQDQVLSKYRKSGHLISNTYLIYGKNDIDENSLESLYNDSYKNIDLYITGIESKAVHDMADVISIIESKNSDYVNTMPNPKIFDRETQHLLETIWYTTLFAICTESPNENDNVIADDASSYGLTFPSGFNIYPRYNTLQIFIDLFKNILSS